MTNLKLTNLFSLFFFSVSASCYRLVCYYDSSAENRELYGRFTIADIDPNKCTHLVYAFSDMNEEHELVPTHKADRQQYWSFNSLKTRNPKLKTLLAVGGVALDKRKFTSMMSTQQKRIKFIQSAIKLLRIYRFDGINIHWRNHGDPECQQEKEKLSFTLLIKELKEAFEAEETDCDRLIVTATVSPERKTVNASYEVPEIAKYLDFMNVMTFDFHGPWESVTGHHSPLYRGTLDTGDSIHLNIDSAMQHWVNLGAPPHKLNMGFAAYGRAFTLSSEFTHVGAPASGAGEEGCYTGKDGFWAVYEVCLYLKDVRSHAIYDQRVPYAITENQWVGYDNMESLNTKVSYLKTNNFGGAYVWSLDLDDFHGRFCQQGNYPFISHLHALLKWDNSLSHILKLPYSTYISDYNQKFTNSFDNFIISHDNSTSHDCNSTD
ncbi:chitinase-3-like protein 2 [Nelusetta ayraudi]|uniref:chitinase-3-like protein 2 n=1 Tax=Nelusetta ayraudi TaxID=303726 RepID=UPI003F70A6B5